MTKEGNKKEPATWKEALIHAVSHAIAGVPAKSLVFLVTLVVIYFTGWVVKYSFDKSKSDSAIVINLDFRGKNTYLFELDGKETRSSKTGKVRFDQVRPGKHFIAVFQDELLLYTAEISVGGGEEIQLSKINLMKVDEEIDKEITKYVNENTKYSTLFDIVIDPGHGGEDPGSIGEIEGIVIKEKFIALEAARSLKRILESKGFSVLLTRDSDYYIPLRRRRDIANENCGRLFISLHADAFMNDSVTGFSAYGISKSGIESEVALLHSADSPLKGSALKNFEKNYLLTDLLAESIINEVSKLSHLHSKHLERAGFVVLKTPSCPALQLNLGFISNSSDRIKLISPEHRNKLATAISAGIDNALNLIK